ncbi:MAG: DMT family transporter [Caldilineaceae bacterium]|nr:DMT family transporter [Caldilineaceae bacterium]
MDSILSGSGIEFSAIVFGLLSALSWGSGDFCGGLAAKRARPFAVVFVAELMGAVLLVLLALSLGEDWPQGQSLLWAGAAGVAGSVGLLALYTGLSTGHMGVVAPLSAVTAAVVPILASLVMDGLPGRPQFLGFVVALAAVWLLSGGTGRIASPNELLLASVAGLGFGFYFVLVDQATSGGIYWNLAFARLMGGVVIGLAIVILRQPFLPPRGVLPVNLLGGALDAGGNLFFGLAAMFGRLDVAAVLSSLYPGMTVMLAWMVLGERLNRPQTVGVVAALLAVTLIML